MRHYRIKEKKHYSGEVLFSPQYRSCFIWKGMGWSHFCTYQERGEYIFSPKFTKRKDAEQLIEKDKKDRFEFKSAVILGRKQRKVYSRKTYRV